MAETIRRNLALREYDIKKLPSLPGRQGDCKSIVAGLFCTFYFLNSM
jgi:hypothetical protein